MIMKKTLSLLIAICIATSAAAQLSDSKIIKPAPITGKKEKLIIHSAYICSYNLDYKVPNYVAWVITPDRVNGKVKRSNNFQGDPAVPKDQRVETSDYYGSHYDRGHMCPAADNRHSARSMDECFYMTNICPQNHNLNSGTWNDLEMQCRYWTNKYKKLYVVSGPIYRGSQHRYFGKKKMRIQVPEAFFKVLLIMGDKPKAVGFIMPNAATDKPYKAFATTIDEVERQTGIDFFPALPDNLENRLESIGKITF